MTKPVSAILAFGALGIALASCGGPGAISGSTSQSSHTTSQSAAVTTRNVDSGRQPVVTVSRAAFTPRHRPGVDDAYDGDDTGLRATEEKDDEEVERYVRPADAAEVQAAASFVKAYFAAALHEDGAAGCALLVPSLAAGLGKSYERPSVPSYLRGKTCAAVMTKLFASRHKLIVAEAAGVRITAVRTTEVSPAELRTANVPTHKTAFVLLSFRKMREPRFMGVEHYGHTFKLEALMDSPYP